MPRAKTTTSSVAFSAPSLRQRAEELARAASSDVASLSAQQVRALVHELQVHQIELEIMNEDLRAAQVQLADARDTYLDLYDFAPVGYFTLDHRLAIRQANLTATTLLGIEREKLIGKRLDRFAAPEDRDALYFYFQEVRESPAVCRSRRLRFLRRGGAAFWARLETSAHAPPGNDFPGYRVVLTDVTSLYETELALRQSEEALKGLNQTLEQRIAERTKAIETLHEIAVTERAKFEMHLLRVAEDVRHDLARELHDDIGQELTGLGLKAETLADLLAPARSPAARLAADIAAALDRTHVKVRRLCRGVMPVELEEGMLADALEQLASATTGGARVECTLGCSGPEPMFEKTISVHLYRIAQEAVSNAVRHGEARHIHIRLERKAGETILAIEDDGKGLSPEAARSEGMGRRTMRYRAALIGAGLEIGPAPSGGTRVVCRMPAEAEVQKPNREKGPGR